jgi:hypothetical protein
MGMATVYRETEHNVTPSEVEGSNKYSPPGGSL